MTSSTSTEDINEIKIQISILQSEFNELLQEYNIANSKYVERVKDLKDTEVKYETLEFPLTKNNCKYNCDNDSTCIRYDFDNATDFCTLYKYSIDSQKDELVASAMNLKRVNKELYAVNEELDKQYNKLTSQTSQITKEEEDARYAIHTNFNELQADRKILNDRDNELLLANTNISDTNSSILFSKISIIILSILGILLLYLLIKSYKL